MPDKYHPILTPQRERQERERAAAKAKADAQQRIWDEQLQATRAEYQRWNRRADIRAGLFVAFLLILFASTPGIAHFMRYLKEIWPPVIYVYIGIGIFVLLWAASMLRPLFKGKMEPPDFPTLR